MGSGTLATRKRKSTHEHSLEELNARLDHISSSVHPVTPYILTIPSSRPVEFSQDHQRQFWVKGTHFPYDEGQLQYVSNFSDWSQGLIHPIGGWDDGQGGIARQDQAPKRKPSASQPAPKKIKLGDYAKKKAANDPRSGANQSSQRQDRNEARPEDGRKQRALHENESGVNGASKKRTVNDQGERARPKPLGSPAKRSHESLLPVEDLPPPLTPLPSRLIATVREYREHVKGKSARKAKDERPSVPAAKAFKRYKKRLALLNDNGAQVSSPRLVVKLKFKKQQKQYQKLSKGLGCWGSGGETAPGLSLSGDAITRLRKLGDDLARNSASADSRDAVCILQLEGVMCETVFNKLSPHKAASRIELWENALERLSTYADTHFGREGHISDCKNVHESERGEQVLRYIVDSLVSIVYVELAACYSTGSDFERADDMAIWLRSEALEYALRASRGFSARKVAQHYPKLWEDSTDPGSSQAVDEGSDWTSLILQGPFGFPLASGTSLEAVRGARRLLMRFCHEIGIEAHDHLGAFAAREGAMA